MRKIFAFNMMTLDGFFEGPNKELDWHKMEDEFNTFSREMLGTIDTLILGRVTYELMAAYWPNADDNDPVAKQAMNSVSKIVCSKTLTSANWNNTRIVSTGIHEELARLKKLPGKEIAIFGSANLVSSLLPSGVIDEYRIMLHPVLLGSGSPLFPGIKEPLNLRLTETKVYQSGNVLMKYDL